MARSKRQTEEEAEPTNASTADNGYEEVAEEEGEKEEEQEQEQEASSEEDDSEEDSMEFSEDEFSDPIWPKDTDICIYINRPRTVSVTNEASEAYGQQFLVFSAVVSDHQIVEGMEDFAGQSAEFMYSRQQGRNRDLKKLFLAAFGRIPAKFVASQLADRCFVVQVRHFQAKDRDNPSEKVTKMAFTKIRPDVSVESGAA